MAVNEKAVGSMAVEKAVSAAGKGPRFSLGSRGDFC
jgi:hypothetical protein